MRYFNTVLFTATLLVAVSFGWSLSSTTGWWGAIDYMLHGSTLFWVFSIGVSLPALLGSRRLPVRTWLKVFLAIVPTAWPLVTLALRGEWSILTMIVVTTAIMTIFATPGSPKNSNKHDTWKNKVRRLLVEPDATTN